MGYYMLQAGYAAPSLASQMKKREDVVKRTGALIESLGGKLLCCYYAFGEYDLIQIIEMPDNISAAALSLVAVSGGALRTAKTTVLMSVDEGMAALKKATTVKYAPPL